MNTISITNAMNATKTKHKYISFNVVGHYDNDWANHKYDFNVYFVGSVNFNNTNNFLCDIEAKILEHITRVEGSQLLSSVHIMPFIPGEEILNLNSAVG